MGELRLNGLAPLEIATHILFGRDETAAERFRAIERPARAIDALEAVLTAALQRQPCLIGFSGGRDSSALLALANRIARREGLSGPVPATVRVPSAGESYEDDWQELVVGHLQIDEWLRVTVDDELDLVGPTAAALMRRSGLPYPYNLHLQIPLLEAARGGSFVTGLGGDEIFATAPPTRRGLARLRRRRERVGFQWLTRRANEEFDRAWSADARRFPATWDRRAAEWWASRYLQATLRRIEALGSELDVSVSHPFADASFVAALTAEFGPTGFATRELGLRELVGDVLPEPVPARASKASFGGVLWSRHARAFLDELSTPRLEQALRDLGVEGLVDAEALHAHWRLPEPQANTYLLLQGAWLALGDAEVVRLGLHGE
jgi:asparagine synthetase B (glutamine-hydrolysing)